MPKESKEKNGKVLMKVPTEEELLVLLGKSTFDAWNAAGAFVETHYEMDVLWDSGRKAGIYEKKYRRSGKTLCAMYAREGEFGFMVVLGQKERAVFEEKRDAFSPCVREAYDGTRQYHDGKWLMLTVKDETLAQDIRELLTIKKRPKRAPEA